MSSRSQFSDLQNTIPLKADYAQAIELRRNFTRIVTGILVVSALSTLGFFGLFLRNSQSSLAILAGIFGALVVTCFVSLYVLRANRFTFISMGLLSIFLTGVMVAFGSLVRGAALPGAVILVLYGLILTSAVGRTGQRDLTIAGGLISAALVALAGTFSPFEQLSLPAVGIVLTGLLALLLMFYVTYLVAEFSNTSLQVRLTTVFIGVVILPLAIFSIIQNQYTVSSLRGQVSESVRLTAQQVAVSMDRFVKNNLDSVKREADNLAFSRYLALKPSQRKGSPEEREVKFTLLVLQARETEERSFLSSYAVLDRSGLNLFDTNEKFSGRFEGYQLYFSVPFLNGEPYLSDVLYFPDGSSAIVFSAPIRDAKKGIVGILRIQFSALVFQRLAENYSGLLGINSSVMLLDENLVRVADTYNPYQTYMSVIPLSVGKQADLKRQERLPYFTSGAPRSTNLDEYARILKNSGKFPTFELELDNSPGENYSEIGAVAPLITKPWKLVYLVQDYNDAPLREGAVRIASIIATVIATVVGILAILISRTFSSPIIRLTQTAGQIAGGDLSARAEVKGSDELGTLASSFNRMTDRLRSFIDQLETRVAERTGELARQNESLVFRSRQLKTVSDVARSIVSSQELEALLDSVTELISERFGFYHVGIFLVDENREFALLRSANSAGGKRMLARSHRLKVGQVGIVGFVTGSGQPRIATDVGSDATFFNNPDLPETRSEMALPLRIGDQIIGALDVQSTVSNAFTDEDVELFTTLADQVSIAIHNNRLYSDTSRALQEAQSVHRQYLRQEWSRDLANRRARTYRYTQSGIQKAENASPDVDLAITSGKVQQETEILADHSIRTTLAVPIQVRGQTIGAIRIQDQGQHRTWTDADLSAVEEVVQQVAAALETARLFERTAERADRERKVLEITGMIRSVNDPQRMLEIAAEELQKALGASQAKIVITPRNGGKPPDPSGN